MSDLALYQAIRAELAAMEERLMATAKEQVAAVTAQLGKAQTEIAAALDALAAAIAAGTVTDEDLQPLRDAAQALDDINPDAPAEEPPA